MRDAELANLAQDAGAAPAVFVDKLEDEFANVSGSPVTPETLRWLFVIDVSDLSHPPAKGAIADD